MTFTPVFPEFTAPSGDLYLSAFPEIERRPLDEWVDYMQIRPVFHADAIIEDGAYCGFITSWHFDRYIYAEHFAICPEKRSGGLGGRALDHFLSQRGSKEVVLEVELPETEMAARRIHFYERHGLGLVDKDYLQPPYHKGGEYFALRLMSTSPEAVARDFEEIRKCIYHNVYGV